MTEPCLNLLLQQLNPNEYSLWCAPEGSESVLPQLAQRPNLTLISNRYDIAEQAKRLGVNTEFNDWSPSATECDAVFLRICKEKSVNFHIANLSVEKLKLGGRFVVAGLKNEGIKTYIQKLSQVLHPLTPMKKMGEAYYAVFTRPENVPQAIFDSQNYNATQVIGEIHSHPIISKPGVYGWNKIDQGSQFLIDTITQVQVDFRGKSVLDLGCGYGYITLACGDKGARIFYATDNNAAACECMIINAKNHDLAVITLAGNCGDTVNEQCDMVLCNPPFHTSFATDEALTEAFLRAAKAKLKREGAAYFVVNSFIPLEKKASHLFKHIQQLANNKQFKVIRLS